MDTGKLVSSRALCRTVINFSRASGGRKVWSSSRKMVLPEVGFVSPVKDEGMPGKRHKPEEIVAKLRQVDALVSQGRPAAEAVRSIGVTNSPTTDGARNTAV